VDSRSELDVLAHQVDAVVHQLDGVQGAPAVPRIVGAVGRLTEELHCKVVHGLARSVDDRIRVVGVPVHRGVQVVEEASVGHVDLAHQCFFGRGAVEPNSALQVVFLHRAFQCNRRPHRAGTEEVVPASVAVWVAIRTRLMARYRVVSDLGQRVVLGEYTDDGTPGAPLGDEGRRHSRHAAPHRKAGVVENIREEFR
jgi:hypothetical protein